MTDEQRDELDRIETERKRREEALLILLLLLIGGAALYPGGTTRRNPRSVRARAMQAIGHGIDPTTAIRDTILGNPRLHLKGVVDTLANAMADTALAATRHVLGAAGVEPTDLPTIPELAVYYATPARTTALAMVDSLVKLTGGAVDEAKAEGMTTPGVARAVSDAFTKYGWTATPPQSIAPELKGSPGWNVSNWATNIVLDAWKSGSGAGWRHPKVASILTGFAHMSILDHRTSEICNERGYPPLILPKDDPYWLDGVPPLHPRCRSVLLGAFGPQVWSTVYPMTPPEPGWGEYPLPIFPSSIL